MFEKEPHRIIAMLCQNTRQQLRQPFFNCIWIALNQRAYTQDRSVPLPDPFIIIDIIAVWNMAFLQ